MRRRQPEGAATDHGDVALAGRHARCAVAHGAGSPRQRPAAAAVTVVVDHRLVAQLLDIHPRTLGPERARAHCHARDAINADAQRRELQRRLAVCAGSSPARSRHPSTAPSATTAPAPFKKLAPSDQSVHDTSSDRL